MNRRELLSMCGAGLTAFAGCTSNQPAAEATAVDIDSLNSSGSNRTTTTSGPELVVALDALQPAVVNLRTDYLELVYKGGRQYLYLDVSAPSGEAPPVSDLAFRVGGNEYAPGPPPDTTLLRRGEYKGGDENRSGWVLFDLPETPDASDAALVWPGGEWHPDQQLRERLAAPVTRLDLVEWRVPETAPLGSTLTFEFTVRNEGEHLGRFVAGINAKEWGALHTVVGRVSQPVPAGESRTWSMDVGEVALFSEEMKHRVGDGEADLEYDLIMLGRNQRRSVRVVEEQTSTDESGG